MAIEQLPGSAIIPTTVDLTQLTANVTNKLTNAYAQANSAYVQANAAYTAANTGGGFSPFLLAGM